MTADADDEPVTGTFLVTAVDEESALLRDVETARIHSLATHPDLEVHEVVVATLEPVGPIGAVWEIAALETRRTVEMVDSDLSPTTDVRERAAALDPGDVERIERAGTGEIHAIALGPESVDAAAEDVLDDEETIARAARLDAVRVEIRRDPAAGLLSIRYLPD